MRISTMGFVIVYIVFAVLIMFILIVLQYSLNEFALYTSQREDILFKGKHDAIRTPSTFSGTS